MPWAPPRACPRCGRVNCTVHRLEPWRSAATNQEATPRVAGRELQRRRRRLFAREPYCRQCLAEGRCTRATIRDHIVPLAEGGPDDETNEQPLCQTCSDRKTATEARRGARRRRGGA